jgi:hypothetical protein
MFRKTLVLRSEWEDAYVRKQVRRNLEADGRPFLVTSGVENQRSIVRGLLHEHQVPHAFFDGEDDEPHKWRCVVGHFPEGLIYLKGEGSPQAL